MKIEKIRYMRGYANWKKGMVIESSGKHKLEYYLVSDVRKFGNGVEATLIKLSKNWFFRQFQVVFFKKKFVN